MISAGNDVVALAAINIARSNQFKFYSKILSETEKACFSQAGLAWLPFEHFVWMLWSVKESAYKYLQRHKADLVFTPIKFAVSNLHVNSGHLPLCFNTAAHEGIGLNQVACIRATVIFADNVLYSCSLLYDELIHSVVSHHTSFENVCWGIRKIADESDNVQSAEVRSLLLERVRKIYRDDNFNLEKKPSGYPVLMRGPNETNIPISLSHHGCFVGYSFPTDINVT